MTGKSRNKSESPCRSSDFPGFYRLVPIDSYLEVDCFNSYSLSAIYTEHPVHFGKPREQEG